MLIVGNWKAYVDSPKDAKALYALAKRLAARSRKVRIAVAPPFPLLGLFSANAKSRVLLASQDVGSTSIGPATGEVSASLLRALGVSYAIVGHSERRAKGETDALIAEKVKRAIASGVTPILCVGERERDPDAHYLAVLKEQIRAVFSVLSPRERVSVVLAYEPVWAIGKRAEDAIDPRDLSEMVLYIRKVLGAFLPGRMPSKTTILYGGSAEPGNARTLAHDTGIQGFLVGHASVDPAMFSALVKALL